MCHGATSATQDIPKTKLWINVNGWCMFSEIKCKETFCMNRRRKRINVNKHQSRKDHQQQKKSSYHKWNVDLSQLQFKLFNRGSLTRLLKCDTLNDMIKIIFVFLLFSFTLKKRLIVFTITELIYAYKWNITCCNYLN